MADVVKVQCCASDSKSHKLCQKCMHSCSCSNSGCACAQITKDSLTAVPCSGVDVKSDCETSCRCAPSCPCYKTGCSADRVSLAMCAGGEKDSDGSCNMPGNCGCNKGSLGKL